MQLGVCYHLDALNVCCMHDRSLSEDMHELHVMGGGVLHEGNVHLRMDWSVHALFTYRALACMSYTAKILGLATFITFLGSVSFSSATKECYQIGFIYEA